MQNKNFTIIHLTETPSTNSFIKETLEKDLLKNETIVFADFQTAGRGQKGNSWESKAGQNLIFSIYYTPLNITANKHFIISEIAALSVNNTLNRYTSDISIKWPNDIYYKDKKICGILIENTLSGDFISYSIIGIGININQEKFVSDAPNPVSLRQITGKNYNLEDILNTFANEFQNLRIRFDKEGFESIHKDYISALYRREGFYKYKDKNGIFEARIKDIEYGGHIILERRGGTLSRYAFKEVMFVWDL